MRARCAWQAARPPPDPNKREGEECTSPRGHCPCWVTPLARPDDTHWSPRERERVCEGDGDGQQTGEWGHSLGDGGSWGGVTTGTCVCVCERRPVAFPVYINVLILNWLWGSQRLDKRVERESGSKVTVWKNNLIKNVTLARRFVAALLFVFFCLFATMVTDVC